MLPILLNLCLGIFKYICGNISALASITTDAANNLTDAITSAVVALGVKMSSTLGGQRHQNGHGRIEWVVGIAVSCSIILVGWESLGNSIEAIKHPSEPEFNVFILLVMLVSIGVKLFLFFFNTKKSKETNSSAYRAAAADCVSDAVSTAVVTIAFLADSLWRLHIDGWCGILVSLFIIRNGFKSFAEVSRRVLGEVENTDLSERLRGFVLAYNGEVIDDVVDLQLIDYGYERYGAFLSVRTKCGADQTRILPLIADLKSAVYQEFGYIVTIEAEIPASPAVERRIKETVCREIEAIDKDLTLADSTRVNEGTDKPQAVINIAVPFEYSKREREIYQKLHDKLKDRDFSYTLKLTLKNARRARVFRT